MTPLHPDWVVPDWPAHPRVRAFVTTRAGGVSRPPFDSFNLGLRSGDEAAHVLRNRALLRERLPAEPSWLRQVHGSAVADAAGAAGEPAADAAFARSPATVCAVLVADCMPVLLADDEGSVVGVAHAGWRGLAGGVVEALAGAMGVAPRRLIAWLGPAIGPAAFEVGEDVLAAFTAADPGAQAAFQPYPGRPGKWLADLGALARRRLAALGVASVHGGGMCTVSEARWFSHRRDRGASGRMAAFIWLAA